MHELQSQSTLIEQSHSGDKNVQRKLEKKLTGAQTRDLQATLRLNQSATATFAAHCTLFLVYKANSRYC